MLLYLKQQYNKNSRSTDGLLFLFGKENIMKFFYTEEQINMIVNCLNSLTVTGMDNAKKLGLVAQTLDQAERVEEKEEQKETGK